MELKIDEAAVRDVVHKAILEQIGVEGRDGLVTAAIAYLMEPQKDRYGSGISPLQTAFNSAIGQAAMIIVREMVMSDPALQARIHEKIGEAIIKMEATDFTDYLGTALSSALRER